MFRVINETSQATETPTTGCDWTNRTDEELFLEYRCTGVRAAFEELVHRYERELYSYLYRYLGDATNAEDVFQKTFLAVLKKCDKFEEGREFRPWLYTIATNRAIDHQRKARRWSMMSIDIPWNGELDACDTADNIAGNEPNPFEDAMDREIADKVREAVDLLPDKMRQVVYMIYFQGLSYRAAAEAVGVHFTTLSKRVQHAVSKLDFMLKNVG